MGDSEIGSDAKEVPMGHTSTAAKPRLTRHQADILDRIRRLSANRPNGLVSTKDVGSRGACQHLIEKGYVEEHLVGFGQRGARRLAYKLAAWALEDATAKGQMSMALSIEGAVRDYFEKLDGSRGTEVGVDLVIRETFVPGDGWKLTLRRGADSLPEAKILRDLARDGVTVVAVRNDKSGRVADFTIESIVK